MADQELEGWRELAHSLTNEDRVRHTPPADLWAAIEAGAQSPAAAGPTPDEILPPEEVIDLTAEREVRAPAAQRKQIRQFVLAGAAAVLAVVLGASLLGGRDEPTTTFVADVTNATMPEAFDGTATATVEVDDAPMLEISFEGSLPDAEPVELWLIKTDPDAGDIVDMRSLGIVKSDATSWSGDWPADLDPTEYSVVDLSIEPNDGDPTHSGRSILRGQLTVT